MDDIFQSLVNEGAPEPEKQGDAVFQALIQQAAASAPKEAPSGTATDQLLQGATFGFSDELGGVGHILSGAAFGETSWPEMLTNYKRGRDQIRAGNQKYQDENFWKSMGLQGLGAIPAAVPAGAAFLSSRAALPMANATKNLLMGSVGGGVASAGLSEENPIESPGGFAADVGTGSALGGTVGVVAPPLIGALGKGGSYLLNSAKGAFEQPAARTDRILQQYLKDGGITTQDQLTQAASKMDDPILADVSQSMRDLTDQIINTPGPGKDIITPKLKQRQAGSGNRILQGLERTTGKNAGFYEAVDKIKEVRKAQSKPLYDEAMAHEIMLTPKLKDLLNRDAIQDAFTEGKVRADIRGQKMPRLRVKDDDGKWVDGADVPDMKTWQTIKQGLDQMIDGQTDKVTGKMSPKGTDFVKLKRELADELYDINPAYRQADSVYSGFASLEGAMKKGLKVLKTDDYLSAKDFERMSAADKEGYLLGAMNAIRDKIEMIPQSHDLSLKQIFTAPAMKRRLEKAFPNKPAYNEFMRIVASEGSKAETNKLANVGSRTASRKMHGQNMALDTAGDLMGASQGNPFSMLRLGGNAAKELQKLPPDALGQLANRLTQPAGSANMNFPTQLMPQYLEQLLAIQPQRAVQAGTGGLLSYGSGNYATK